MTDEIEFYEVLVGEGDEQVTVYLNWAHVVDVTEDDDGFTIHMSDGRAHNVSSASTASFQAFLKASKVN